MGRYIKCRVKSIISEFQWKEQSRTLELLHYVDSGINQTWYGRLDDNTYGYLKNCTNTDSDMDYLEVWIAFLGTRLGISMAETYLIFDEDQHKLGCFSVDVANDGGQYITANQMKEQWLLKRNPIPDWAIRAHEIYQSSPKIVPLPDHIFSLVENPEQLTQLLIFIYCLLSKEGRYDVRNGFVDMILLDCLIWQKDRNMNGFGLLEMSDDQIIMAGLYDNASITMPGLDESLNGFCNILCHRHLLIQCLMDLFSEQVLDFAVRLKRFLDEDVENCQQLQSTFIPAAYNKRLNERMAEWKKILGIIHTYAQVLQ